MSLHDHRGPAGPSVSDWSLPNPQERLDRASCLALLATVPLGRVGLSVDALPVIVPVGFRLVGERLVLAAHADPRAVAAIDGVVVAFQADHWDPDTASGWSVLVQGPARRVVDRGDLGALGVDLVASGWMGGTTAVVVVPTEVISGCRLTAAPDASSGNVGGRRAAAATGVSASRR